MTDRLIRDETPKTLDARTVIDEAMHAQADLLAMLGLGHDWKKASIRCAESIAECDAFLSPSSKDESASDYERCSNGGFSESD